jgi:DNA polymerase III subunit gamma/tau
MSDVVLARKYRPRSFEQMVGQAHVVQALGNALTSGRLHHAYLFTGTRGIGKTTVSRILAKSLNCTGVDGRGGITATPCGVCQACTEIDADRYIDYIELDAASNRSIDEIRDLIERAAYKPSVGRFKVFMIDEAHQLTKDAFNALLKTLEEPPDYLKFVLATTDPDKMLPTVLSRCLQFNLRPMAPEVVHGHLQAVLQAEGVAADAGALRLLSRAARGSMRDALSLADQAIAYGAGAIDEAGVRAMLGAVDRHHAASLVLALARRDGVAVLQTIDALRGLGLSAAGTLEEVSALLQQMAVEQAVPGALDDDHPDTAVARQLAGELPADETQLLYSIVVHGRAELGLVADEYAALTMVLLRLLAFAPTASASAAAGSARAAPLAVAPRESRSTAAVRPAVSVPPRAAADAVAVPSVSVSVPAVPIASAMPAVAEPAIAATAAAARRRAAAAPSAQLPPWIDDAPPDDGQSAAADLSSAGSGAAAPAGPAELPSRREPQPFLTTTALGDQWAALIRPLLSAGGITALVRELALQSELIAVTALPDGGHCWRLRVERESLHAPALRDKLQAALAAALGEPVTLDLEAGTAQDCIARREAAAREAAQQDAERLIQDDPAVRELMLQFRTARIVPGSIKPLTEPRMR